MMDEKDMTASGASASGASASGAGTSDAEASASPVSTAVDEGEELLGLTVGEALEKALLFAFDEATQILEQGGTLTPFSVMVVGEELYVENHPGDDVAECFTSAQKTIFSMQLEMDSYVFCYDGYVELDGETKDAIVAEAAKTGDESAHAYALIYQMDDGGKIAFEESLADLGEAPVLFMETSFELEELGGDAGPEISEEAE